MEKFNKIVGQVKIEKSDDGYSVHDDECFICGTLGINEDTQTKVKCGLITCIHNNGKRVCSNKNLELNYFDDYSIFGDKTLPNTDTKITDYLSTHIGHFMGVQCKDFKMDKYKVMRNPKNG